MAKKNSPVSNTGKSPLIKWLWILGITPIVLVILLIASAYLSGLPKVEDLANPRINLATRVLSIDGKTIGTYYKENREDITYRELPTHLIDALIATEDVRYLKHSGVDVIGLSRALFMAGTDGGGSTITQQFAKMLFTERYENVSLPVRVFQKIREWIIACRIESLYTKEEIIAMYLNQYDFLNQAVGIKSAAKIYFDTTPEKLTIEQSAMLIGMLKNSSLFNPLRREELVTKRREVVLNQMEKYGFINQSQYDSLRVLPLGLNFQRMSHDEGMAPYFREILRLELEKLFEEKNEDGSYRLAKSDGQPYDLYRDGLKVYTTIDARLQEHAEWAVIEHLKNELQPLFSKDLSRRNKENYPFYNRISKSDMESIMQRAVKDSDRYKFGHGKMCPDCKRPELYISEETSNGRIHFFCDTGKKGCGHKWAKPSDEDMEKEWDRPVAMKVFTHFGPKDTVLSPMDSIRYHKTILHASLMSIEPRTGFVKAWVGGIDYKTFKFDNVYQSARQVGSTFKPFVYATALRMGKDPSDPVDGSPFCWGSWCPQGGGGTMSMKCAIANSVNTVAARLAYTYGIDNVIKLARRLGITAHLEPTGPLALGAANIPLFQMVGAISSFANDGVYIQPRFFLRIEDKNGTAIYEAPTVVEQALDPCDAYQLLSIMKAVVDGSCGSGTGVRLRYSGRPYGGINYPTAGKTGTTQNNSDGWFIGITPDLTTGVWVGAQDPTVRFTSTAIGQGANTGLPIYGYYMKKLYADPSIKISKGDFKPPERCGTIEEKEAVMAEEMIVDYDELFNENEAEEPQEKEQKSVPTETQEIMNDE
jgi:penicillin-binding protein 1A